MLARA